MPNYTYTEELGDLSPSSGNFSNQSQTASGTYLFSNPTFDQLRLSIIDLLGYTGTTPTDGRIKRTLPVRHPGWQWLFADSCSPQGVGSTFSTVTIAAGPYPATLPSMPLYASYHYRVNFSQRPYNVWQDNDISLTDGTGYQKDGTSYTYKFANEWQRFTTFDMYPTNQFITAQQGQMVFRASGSGGAVQPNLITFQDSPKLYLPDSILKVRWYQVPYRYLTSSNSYLTKFIGHINQTNFGPNNVDGGYGPYLAGSLLYLGANPTATYTPPIPDPGLLAFNKGNGFVRSRLCDLELSFLYTARTIGTVTANTPDMSAVNANWIVAGHNLLPWLTTRKYYYATTYDPVSPSTNTKWFPSYNSFPFQLLFTDPDAPATTSPILNP